MRAIPTQLLALAGQVLKDKPRGPWQKQKGQRATPVLVYARMLQASLRKPALLCFPMAPSLITGPSSVISVADVLGKSKSSSTMMQGCSPKVGLPAKSNDPWPERFSPATRYSHSLLGLKATGNLGKPGCHGVDNRRRFAESHLADVLHAFAVGWRGDGMDSKHSNGSLISRRPRFNLIVDSFVTARNCTAE